MRLVLFYKKLLLENRLWLKRIAMWAGLWLALGVLTFTFRPQVLPAMVKALQTIFRDIIGQSALQLDFRSVLLIFKNNLIASLIVLFFGVIFGILPLLSVAVNFFILGFLFAVFALSRNHFGIPDFFLSLVPHGIIEIPSLLLAAAFGLRLGVFWAKPAGEPSIVKNLMVMLKQNLQLVPLLVVLFFVSALLEIFVTGNLVKLLLK